MGMVGAGGGGSGVARGTQGSGLGVSIYPNIMWHTHTLLCGRDVAGMHMFEIRHKTHMGHGCTHNFNTYVWGVFVCR